MLLLRSLLFQFGMSLSTLLYAIPSALSRVLPFPQRYRFISSWSRFNLWWLKLSCKLDFKIIGLENIPEQPAIILCKHQSAWETLALQQVFPAQVWVLKRELLWIPFFGWGLAALEPIAIDRSSGHKAIRQIIDQGRARLNDGRWIVIFPEGTRIPPGETGRYGIGGAVVAEKTQATVIPVAHNAGYFWPKRGFIKQPGTITLSIGPAINSEGKTAEEIREQAKQWIETECQRIGKT